MILYQCLFNVQNGLNKVVNNELAFWTWQLSNWSIGFMAVFSAKLFSFLSIQNKRIIWGRLFSNKYYDKIVVQKKEYDDGLVYLFTLVFLLPIHCKIYFLQVSICLGSKALWLQYVKDPSLLIFIQTTITIIKGSLAKNFIGIFITLRLKTVISKCVQRSKWRKFPVVT